MSSLSESLLEGDENFECIGPVLSFSPTLIYQIFVEIQSHIEIILLND